MNQTTTGHVCNCCHGVNGEQTKENPMRTDWCVKCGHRGEGIRRAMKQLEWGQLRVVFTAPPQPPVDGEVAELIELMRNEAGCYDSRTDVRHGMFTHAADLLERLTSDNAGLVAAADSLWADNISLLDGEVAG